jgi:mono/diheme cytochrome c family protein
MCHQSDKNIIPIGPKIRNLNMDIIRNGSTINQLQHLQNIGIMAQMNPASFGKLPNWKSGSYALEERARAYLDVNCGHCHNNRGFASNSSLRLTYETSLGNSHIRREKNVIDILMSRGTMPLIGTTIIDKEGLQLIQKYLQTL